MKVRVMNLIEKSDVILRTYFQDIALSCFQRVDCEMDHHNI